MFTACSLLLADESPFYATLPCGYDLLNRFFQADRNIPDRVMVSHLREIAKVADMMADTVFSMACCKTGP